MALHLQLEQPAALTKEATVGIPDTEIKTSSAENPELTKFYVLSFKARSRSEYSQTCFAHY